MNTQNKQPEPSSRPIILEIEETKNNIIQEMNRALRKGVPCYLLYDALEGVVSQIREGAKAELEAARAQEAIRAQETPPAESVD